MPEFKDPNATGLKINVLRRDTEPNPNQVTFVELFFDLVFVLAIKQISTLLDASPTPQSLGQALLVCLAVWWIWVYTTWATNWLNPESRPVMWLILLLMVGGLIFSDAIPEAFGDKGLLFAGTYVAYCFIRALFIVLAAAKYKPAIAMGQRRLLVWLAISTPLWIIGALTPPGPRLALWSIALLIDYGGPAALFWLPKLGRVSWDAYQIRGAHFAERSALFIIIVLGESILVTGEGLQGESLTFVSFSGFAAAFTSSILLWLLYFARGERRGTRYISARRATGPVARISYTYLHAILVIGIVATTHANALVLHDPRSIPEISTIAFVTLGPLLYIVGNMVFARSVGRPWSVAHLGGILALGLLLTITSIEWVHLTALALAWVSTAILAGVVVFENRREWQSDTLGVEPK
jgi:low temperature requirement protein LtrA